MQGSGCQSQACSLYSMSLVSLDLISPLVAFPLIICSACNTTWVLTCYTLYLVLNPGLYFGQNDGRLRLSRQGIIFKNSKTGKVDNIQAGELTEGIWRRVALGHGLKLLTKNGHVYKYDGFRESVRDLVTVTISFLKTVLSYLFLVF